MNLYQKIIRRFVMKLSQLGNPKHRMSIKHAHIEGFDILVMANEDVGRQIYSLGSFEPDETVFFRSVITEDDVCFDIGGNVGYFAMLMAQCASRGSVHVFEPIPLNAAIIRTNANINDFEHVTVNNVAVGDKSGSIKFTVAKDSAYSSMHSTGRVADSKVIDVPMITLDEYANEHGIDKINLIKIDVEGAEELVARGAVEILTNPERRPATILMELFDENLQPFGTDVNSIVNLLIKYGYKANVLANGTKLTPYSPDMANRYYNIIFIA